MPMVRPFVRFCLCGLCARASGVDFFFLSFYVYALRGPWVVEYRWISSPLPRQCALLTWQAEVGSSRRGRGGARRGF